MDGGEEGDAGEVGDGLFLSDRVTKPCISEDL